MSWRRLSRYRWLRWTAAGALLATVVTGSVAWYDARRADSNASVLADTCAGLLPQDAIRAVLPGDEDWKRGRHGGTVLVPDEPSRLYLTCALITGDTGSDRGGALGDGGAFGVTVTAAPVLDQPLTKGVRVERMADEGYDDDGNDEADPAGWAADLSPPFDSSVDVRCPNGLPGQRAAVDTFRVVADIALSRAGRDTTDTARADRAEARTVAAVANHIARTLRCDAARVQPSDVRAGRPDKAGDADTDTDTVQADPPPPASCAWLQAAGEELRYTGDWEAKGTGRLTWGDACTAAERVEIGDPPSEDAVSLSSGSWSGEAEREARLEYANELSALRRTGRPVPRLPSGDSGPELVVWAMSECDGGRTALHRVSAKARKEDRLPAAATAALDAYLRDARGWPDRHHCARTRVLGKVWV